MKYRTTFSGECNYGIDAYLDVILDLPELEGSEKQVAWANTIRLNYVSEIIQRIPYAYGLENGIFAYKEEATPTSKAVLTTTEKLLEMLKKINGIKDLDSTSAKYWIENR